MNQPETTRAGSRIVKLACLIVIIAGLRTAAVMNIGIAAIAAYIGSGGLGVFIQQGIGRVYDQMIIAGALMVSFLAIFVDAAMKIIEKFYGKNGLPLTSN